MDKLIATLNDHHGDALIPLPLLATDLQEAAEAWAIYCLRTHKDELLGRGLAISDALCQYVTELNRT